MAGGKETPRQKMIGMMYLVLTALLALNVSTAVLDKFLVINSTLEELVKEETEKNQATLNQILKSASENKAEKVQTAAEKAKVVRELTERYVKKMEEYKEMMVAKTGGRNPETGVPIGVTDYDKVANMMITTEVGKNFERDLNDFVKELNKVTELQLPLLARPAKEIPMFASNPNHANKSYLEITFESTPTVAGMVSVTQAQVEMLEYESKALEKLAQDADAAVVKFTDLVPMVKPKSSVVAAGAKYTADMFIAASNSGISPEMFRNGQPVPVVDDPKTGIKMGKIEFTASATNYDPKTMQARQTFTAEIKLNEETYTLEEEYFVAKPVIRVTTGNRPTLYRNCGNLVNINVPSLEGSSDYNPAYSGRGATITKGSKVGEVIIVPSERECSVTVTNGGMTIGTETFSVKNIPKPRYVSRSGSAEINLKDGLRAAALASIRVTADPDPNFKEEVPQDATYRIRRVDVSLVRGTAPVAQQSFTNENVEIGAWRSQARPGDFILIDIRQVERRNYKGEAERISVDGSEGIIQIPIK